MQLFQEFGLIKLRNIESIEDSCDKEGTSDQRLLRYIRILCPECSYSRSYLTRTIVVPGSPY